jgi:hypothetical protein
MSFELSITADKNTINLGETVTVTYYGNGAYDTTIQSDNMPNSIDLGGPGEISGSMRFLPVHDGTFSVTLTAYGVVHQSKGIDPMSNPEVNSATVTITVN